MVLKTVTAVVLGALVTLGALVSLSSTADALRGARIRQPAPEISGGPWINSEPLTLEKLRGRVVFVEFWTYG
ncbi:MAG: hypothetical protein ACE5HV_16345 [Acidobacteriota bacterium]